MLAVLRVQLLVQTRRARQGKPGEKSDDQPGGDKRARFHLLGAKLPFPQWMASVIRPALDTHALLRYESRLEVLSATRIYFAIFGLLTIAGGIMGYLKAGSVISVVAGAVSGALLLLAALLLPEHRVPGLIIGLVVSLLLAIQFAPKFFSTGKLMPAGMMAVLSVIGIILGVVAWLRG